MPSSHAPPAEDAIEHDAPPVTVPCHSVIVMLKFKELKFKYSLVYISVLRLVPMLLRRF